jgi:hypothetical protein
MMSPTSVKCFDMIVIIIYYRPREPQCAFILTGAAYINEQWEGNQIYYGPKGGFGRGTSASNVIVIT